MALEPINIQNIIPLSSVMNTTLTSQAMQVWMYGVYSIQVAFSGTPTGTFVLQASSDPVFGGVAPSNWSTIPQSSYGVTASGNYTWNVMQPGYNWVQLIYTDASGGTSTAQITDSTFNGSYLGNYNG